MADWSTRIPAAIEKAQLTYDIFKQQDDEATQWFGHALALAEALNDDHGAHWKIEEFGDDYAVITSCDESECVPCAALRAYTEKIESMSPPVHRRS